jgi:hypothetical protein
LDYQIHNNNTITNYSEEILSKENKKLREEAHYREEKLDILFNFLINMQHSIMNKTSSISVLQNLDILTLRTKINEIQEETFELVYKNNKQNNFPADNFNGTMKSSSNQMYGMRNFKDLYEDNEKAR